MVKHLLHPSLQEQKPSGTADAVKSALKKIPSKRNNNILILCGDVPFISSQSLNIMIKKLSQSDLCLGTFNQANPKGYGRIIRDGHKVIKIIEEKDASEKIKKITEINTGCLLYTSPSPRDRQKSRMPSSA